MFENRRTSGHCFFKIDTQKGSSSHCMIMSNPARLNPRSRPPMPEKKDATVRSILSLSRISSFVFQQSGGYSPRSPRSQSASSPTVEAVVCWSRLGSCFELALRSNTSYYFVAYVRRGSCDRAKNSPARERPFCTAAKLCLDSQGGPSDEDGIENRDCGERLGPVFRAECPCRECGP